MSDDPGIEAPSPAIRALLATYRDRHRMPREAYERVAGRLDQPVAGRIRVAALAFAAAAAAIVGLIAVDKWRAEPARARAEHDLAGDVFTRDGKDEPSARPRPGPQAITPAELQPLTPQGPALAEPAAGLPHAEGAHAVEAARRGKAPADREPTAAGSSLAAERRLLGQANEALAAGELSTALALVARHAREFPRGLLVPEIAAARTMARCRQQRGKASTELEAFISAHPGSVLLPAVRAACSPNEN